MRILLTRPREESEALAAALRTLGHDALIAPLMDVTIAEGPSLNLEPCQGVLATSANGVRALAQRTSRRDLTVYAVGPQTAEAARRAGFTVVRASDGDALALAEAVASWAMPDTGALLHAAGAETTGRLRQWLQAKGFAVTTEILYQAKRVEKLPQNAADALANDALDGVMLFSPRSARIFAELVTADGLASHCTKLACFCISAATATEAGSLPFASVKVAGAPNQDAILALISESP